MAQKEKYIAKAQKYILKGYLDKAIAEYRAALDFDPKDISIRLRLGDLFVKSGSKAEAIAEYTEAAKANSQRGFYLKAIAVYKQILKLDDTILDVHKKLAELYTKQRLNADSISEYSYILNILEKSGKIDESIELIKKMLDIDPENVGVRIRLAETYQKAGFKEDALVESYAAADRLVINGKFDRVEKIYLGLRNSYPENTDVMERLCDLYRQSGNEAFAGLAGLLAERYRDEGKAERASALETEIVEAAAGDEGAPGMPERGQPDLAAETKVAVEVEHPAAAGSSAVEEEPVAGTAPEAWTDVEGPQEAAPEVAVSDEGAPEGEPLPEVEGAGAAPGPVEEPEEGFEITLEGFDDDEEGEDEGEGPLEPLVDMELPGLDEAMESAAEADVAEEPSGEGGAASAEIEEPMVEVDIPGLEGEQAFVPAEGIEAEAVASGEEAAVTDEVAEAVERGEEVSEPEPEIETDIEIDIPAPVAEEITETAAELVTAADEEAGEGAEEIASEVAEMEEAASARAAAEVEADSETEPEPDIEIDIPAPVAEEITETAAELVTAADEEAGEGAEDIAGEMAEMEEAASARAAAEVEAGPDVEPEPEPDIEIDIPAPVAEEITETAAELVTAADDEAGEGAEEIAGEMAEMEEAASARAAAEVETGPYSETEPEPDIEIDIPAPVAEEITETAAELVAAADDEAGEGAEDIAGEMAEMEEAASAGAMVTEEPDFDRGEGISAEVIERVEELLEEGASGEPPSVEDMETGAGAGTEPTVEEPVAFEDIAAEAEEPEEGPDAAASVIPEEPEPTVEEPVAFEDIAAEAEEPEEGPGAAASVIPEEPEPTVEEPVAFEDIGAEAEEPAPPEEFIPAVAEEELSDAINELMEKIEPEEHLLEAYSGTVPPPHGRTDAERREAEEYVDLSAELGMEEALEGLTQSWRSGEESGESLDEFRHAIGQQLTREDSETHYNLGIAYMEMELYDEAAKEFKIALKDPNLEFDCYIRLGLSAMEQGLPDEAKVFYLKGIKVEGRTEEERLGLFYELALAYEASGEAEAAAGLFFDVYSKDRGFREIASKIALYATTRPSIPLDDGMIEVELL